MALPGSCRRGTRRAEGCGSCGGIELRAGIEQPAHPGPLSAGSGAGQRLGSYFGRGEPPSGVRRPNQPLVSQRGRGASGGEERPSWGASSAGRGRSDYAQPAPSSSRPWTAAAGGSARAGQGSGGDRVGARGTEISLRTAPAPVPRGCAAIPLLPLPPAARPPPHGGPDTASTLRTPSSLGVWRWFGSKRPRRFPGRDRDRRKSHRRSGFIPSVRPENS